MLFVLFVTVGSFDTAMAQTITLSPTSLAFCVPATNSPSPLPQTLTVSSTPNSTNYNANATKSWIKLNGNVTPPSISGNTQFSPNITVQIDPSGYASGSNTGLIQVAAGGTLATASVTINVTASCSSGSTMTANPTSVNLTPSTTAQNVQIGGATGSASAVVNYGNGPAGWFVLDNTTFNSPSFNVNVSLPSTPGVNYGGSFTITVNGTNNSVTVPVNFVIGGTGNGAFTATPWSISQTFATNASAATDTMIAIGAGSVTGVNLSTSISLNGGPSNWITFSALPAGPVPTTATVHIDPTNLTPGFTYTGSVTFSQTSNSTNSVTVPISAVVTNSGIYSLSPNPVTFTIPSGTTGNVSQFATLSGPNVTIATGALAGNGPTGWFSITPSSATINRTLQLTVTVSPSVLTAGVQYQGTGVILQNGNQVFTFPVNAIIGGVSSLTITPSQLNFAWQTGTSAPPTQTINVSSAANTQVSFSVNPTVSNCGNNWIVVNTNQSFTNGTSPVAIFVSISTSVLPANTTCTGNVAISTSTSITTVPVSVLVSNNPIMTATPASLNFTFQPGTGTPLAQSVSLSSSNASTQLNFSAAVNP